MRTIRRVELSDLGERRMRTAIKNIEGNPKSWKQSVYSDTGLMARFFNVGCGTRACLAGHLVLASGVSYRRFSTMESYEIQRRALNLLGLGNPGRIHFINQVFLFTHPGSLDDFKERITEVTGIVFEPASYDD